MICPNCGKTIEDGSRFCVECGASIEDNAQAAPNAQQAAPNAQQAAPNYQQPYNYQQQPYYDPKDHTAEFDKKDISDNKVFAMLPYLLDLIGVFISVIAAGSSPYTRFHVKESLKYTVCTTLLTLMSALLFFTLIIPVAAVICNIIIFVCRIISFVRICKGQAKEATIVGGFGFLK